MFSTLKALAIAARLLAAPVDGGAHVADEICAEHWTPGGDGHAACTVGLETWRCERQGWCDPCESAPYEACESTLPDPVKAGREG